MGGNGQRTSEIYSPPYLFKGTRPTITSAPANRRLRTDLLRPNARRRSNFKGHDAETLLGDPCFQHEPVIISTLNFSQAPGGLNVVAPSGAAVASPATVAPPGHYLLFILNGSGVPSVAKIVQVATLNSIEVTPANQTIQTGTTRQFTATGTYSNTTKTQNITSQVTWTSSNTAVATINGSGLATGMSAGSTNISATLPGTGVTRSTALTVQAAPAPLAITTSSLPTGTVNIAYSATLAASGGAPPYVWSLNSGALPSGLNLSCE